MIPRLHPRGNSFKGALGYVLHDVGKESSERVAWVTTQNIFSHPEDAWFEMFSTYRDRAALKKNAGVDARGRDNKTPVLHYTLAWHASDNPSSDHMKLMAVDSLKALGLSEHEAVIACHTDKEHHHVHLVVNTVHPYTGKTAALKFSKLEFSRWAEAYEKEHGIHCEQRIENNERRREIAELREKEREAQAFALLTGKKAKESRPFEPVNDNSDNRRRWLERKDIIDKMKSLRRDVEAGQKAERGELWTRQLGERDELDKQTHAKLDVARTQVQKDFKPRWRDVYQTHKRELRDFSDRAGHPLERAVFVFQNRERLSQSRKSLTLKQMIPLILSRKKLRERLLSTHARERRALARDEKAVTRQRTDRVWQEHRATFHALKDRQTVERSAQRSHQQKERADVSFMKAKEALLRELDAKVLKPQVPSIPGPGRDAKRPVPKRDLPSPKDVLMRNERPKDIPAAAKLPLARQQPDASPTMKAFDKAAKGLPSTEAERQKMLKDWETAMRRRPKGDFERER